MQFAKNLKNIFSTKNLLMAGTGLTLQHYLQQEQERVSCCGIIGVVSKNNKADKILVEGVNILQNRGYDSAGLCTLSQGQQDFMLTKIASKCNPVKLDCIDEITRVAPELHKNAFIGIAHTRWATCGEKTDENSHPHLDYSSSISIVHNGTLDNYEALRERLQKEHGIVLRSQTDSEIIAHYIKLYQDRQNCTIVQALQDMIEDKIIEGQWGLVIMDKNQPNKLVVARRGSPLEIGIGEDSIYVASEKIAFQNHTNKFISLQENEIMELDIDELDNITKNNNRIKINSDNIKVEQYPKEPYKSFFEQEMSEQFESIMKTLQNGARLGGPQDGCKLGGLEKHAQQLSQIENIVIIACGSSLFASQYAVQFMKKLKCMKSVQCVEGSEFCEYDLPQGQTAVVLVSQSGETADLRRALEIAKKAGVFSIGIINAVGSQIATSVDCGIYLNCGREVAVAATKSFTSQVVAMIMLSIWLSKLKDKEGISTQKRIQYKQGLQLLPVTVGSTLVNMHQDCFKAAKYMAKIKTIICLGKGPCGSIAKEGALKIKELTYIHAEAFSAGELKHGPLALIDSDVPKSACVVLIILDDQFFNDMNLCLAEVHSRGALTVVITDCKNKINKEKTDHIIEISNAGELTSLCCALAFQKITVDICNELNIQPDKPRNLAKTVTVH